jgi:predicted DNA-binding transcriptional regulator YafY
VIHAVDVADYTEQAFKMYNGKIESITVSFSRDLIGVIYDKFGEDTEIWQEDGRYAANVKVQISPTFWGWLFQFGGRMRIQGPAVLQEEMGRQLSLLADKTKD